MRRILTESEDTGVVNLRLDERSRVKVDLGTYLEADVARRRRTGIVHGLRASLHVGVDAVVVARGERAEVAETVEGDGVLGRAVTDGGRVFRDLALGDVVRRLSTDEEAVAADDGVSGEGGALANANTQIRK